uniref:Ubiquitin-like protease family profile domain-containing protein n=1 Tax=Brassica oleracea var. oleracea TaxID=109376 RepID=A0A0D3AAH5_BRAOL
MFNAKSNWKWTMDCWEVTGTNPRVKKEVSAAETESGVKEESATSRKKAHKRVRREASVEATKMPSAEVRAEASTSVGGMTKEQIEKSFRDIADVMRDGFGMCLKEIKLLGDRMEAMEKKVGITKKGTASNELQITTSNLEKRGNEPGSESVNEAKAGQNDTQKPSSSKDMSLVIANEPEEKPPEQSGEPSVLVLDKGVPIDSDLQKEETRRQRKRDAAMVHVRGKSERARKLAASQQNPFKGNNTAKVIIPNKRVGQGYDPFAPSDKKMSKLLTDWVKLDPYFKTPMAKKPRRCTNRFYFTLRTPLEWLNDGQWSHKYPELKSDEGDINNLGRRLPGGAWNYHAGIVPTFCQSMKISIPKRHIVVLDNILTHIKAAYLDVLMDPFVNMVPYLLIECAGSDEEHVKHTLEPYTYERVTVGVPQCRAGDCGVFALKYIECHALRMSFPPEFCNKSAKAIREKMALDIFKETPEGHAKENEDNDENLRTYDEQGY